MASGIPQRVDLLVVGGGIHGAAIARDAAGRGLTVLLVEREDLAAHTSSATSKLVHGGLRYLERGQLRLVREALAEREVLLRAAPHLVRARRFVMPQVPQLRPAWMIRAGLLLYDWLARRHALPASAPVDLLASDYGRGLRVEFARGFVYSDCTVDDARLVVATARSAADLGAAVALRTACVAARGDGRLWRATLRGADGALATVVARALVNATGPWAASFLARVLGLRAPAMRQVRGSHILVPRLYEGEHAFLLQHDERRVVFACGYERDYTLLGTTEVEHEGEPGACSASAEEIAYLCRAANRYFERRIGPADVAWSYCGIRLLADARPVPASALSRDYRIAVEAPGRGPPVVSVFGGKLTTHRRLAERVLAALAPWLGTVPGPWTASAVLPGGELGGESPERFSERVLGAEFPWAAPELRRALVLRHGALARELLAAAGAPQGLGTRFGPELYGREVDYFVEREWARSAEDVLWRRTKCGLRIGAHEREALARYLARRCGAAPERDPVR